MASNYGFHLNTVLVLIFLNGGVRSQENAGTSVSPALMECYNNSEILTRDLRLPATVNILVELIRKSEDGNPSINTRELAVQLLHRFRQDGIYRNQRFNETAYGLPFSPRGSESYKNRVQLKKLTPGNAITFNNDSLTVLERCSLHSMVSSTIEYQERGDEATVCTSLSRYTRRLHRRSTNPLELSGGGAVEKLSSSTRSGSSCPIESGVIYTRWGAVKAGLILSGIAAGFQQLSVPSAEATTADNRYSSTLAGELAEAALYQASDSIKIGSNGGGWNTTIIPKYYFIQQQDNVQVTDAELRGSLDGLIIALNVDGWKAKYANLKASQIIDMYYSTRGVFNQSIRACNRKVLIGENGNQLVSADDLLKETTAFTYLLDDEALSVYSVDRNAFSLLVQNSINSYNTYVSTLNDLECAADNVTVQRVKTDLFVFLDTGKSYRAVQPVLAYILDNIDVNKYESRYTLYDGASLQKMINTTSSILDFYENYTLLEHQTYPTGFDYNRIYELIEELGKNQLNNSTDVAAGQSTIIVLVPNTAPTDTEKQYVLAKRDNFKIYLPNIRIVVLGTGSQDSYNDLVLNSSSDIFIVTDTTDQNTQISVGKSVVERLRNVHRNVINPNCRSNFQTTSSSSSFDLIQYVEPQGLNYHRIAANYFTVGSSDTTRKLLIKASNYGTVIVCMSRSDNYPRSTTTTDCATISNSEEKSYDIGGYCDDSTVSSCQPIYLSIEGGTSNVRCSDSMLCRFPDNIKYTITMENVGCSAGRRPQTVFIGLFSSLSAFTIIISRFL